MLSKTKKFISVIGIIVLLLALSGCDLYDPETRENITMNPEKDENKVDYLDGKDPVDGASDEEVIDANEEIPEAASLEAGENSDGTGASDNTVDGSSDSLQDSIEDTWKAEEVSAQDQELAKELNSEGYNFYKEGFYVSAMNKFKESMDKDTNYFYAHFNYACTLGVLMKEDYPTWYESKDKVIKELKICLEIDPSSKSKIMKDADLDPVKAEFEYLTDIAGYDIGTTDGVQNILQQSNWYIQGNGVISVLGQVDFDGNKVSFTYVNLEKFDEGIIGEPIISTGTYSNNGHIITFKMDKATLKRRSLSDIYDHNKELDDQLEFYGALSSDGILTIAGFEYSIYTWFDEFSA